MTALRLRHLTFVGAGEPAFLEFGEHLTVIHGASDTGKSFIVSAIDFVLGSNRLKDVPEAEGYTHALLGIELPDSTLVTLTRPTNGGRISLYDGDVRVLPPESPRTVFSGRSGAKAAETVSDFLMDSLGLTGRRVLKNARGETQSLTFRGLAHLCIVTETQMQSEVPPALTGQYISRTAERSALRALLQNDDDAAIEQSLISEEEARLGRSKLQVLEQLQVDLMRRMDSGEGRPEVEARLVRLAQSVDQITTGVEELLRERDGLVAARNQVTNRTTRVRNTRQEKQELRARFRLLQEQYASDLARLELVREAGTFLGFFSTGSACAFCGAVPEHQDLMEHQGVEVTNLDLATRSEEARIRILQADLSEVEDRLQAEISMLMDRQGQLSAEAATIDTNLEVLDRRLVPLRTDLPSLLDARSGAIRLLALYEQIESIERMREGVVIDDASSGSTTRELSPVTSRAFEGTLRSILSSWQVIGARALTFDASSTEMFVAGQARADRGKGMRAILHACFTLGLADYTIDRSLPHPGFVVLDSPVVTFRPPESAGAESMGAVSSLGSLAEDEDYVSQTAFDRFYNHVNGRALAQVIVVENVSPPDLQEDKGTRIYHFTANEEVGRYGFFPHRPALLSPPDEA